MFRLIAVVAVIASAVGCGGTTTPEPREVEPPAPTPVAPLDPETPRPPGDAARGEKLFAELGCKGCHGGKGEGGGIGPDLFVKPWDDAMKTSARATIRRGFPDR